MRLAFTIKIILLVVIGLGTLAVAGYLVKNTQTKIAQLQAFINPKPIESNKVSISRDKSEYNQVETVKIVIQNNSEKSIWYWDHTGQSIPLVGIQRLLGGEWRNIEKKSVCACKDDCTTYATGWIELKPKTIVTYSWDLRQDCSGNIIDEGIYRVWFSYNIDSTGLDKEEDFFKVYSKEFDIMRNIESKTEDWNTYRNEEYGFELRYPQNLTTEERTDSAFKSFSVFLKSNDLNGYFLVNNPGVGTGFDVVISSENILIDGINAKLEVLDSSIDNERAVAVSFSKDKNDFFWLFRFNKNDTAKLSLAKKAFSAFRFTRR